MRRTAVLLLTAVLAAGCSTTRTPAPPAPSTSSAAPTEAPTRAAPPPAAPRDGTCHDLTYTEAVAPTARSSDVACGDEHTSQTFHVGTLDRVVGGRLLAVDARRLQDEAAAECPDRLAELLGGTEEQRRLSMLRSVWFTPTVGQSDRGADWLRCDAVAVAGPETLLPLAGPLGGVLDTEAGRERYGMCGTAEPGTGGFERVACATRHSWRALRTVGLPDGDYPGQEVAQAAGETPCTDAGRAAADDPLDFQWGYEWPTAEQWAAGQTYGICWAPDA
ncbi:hypothetical protein GCM10009623_33990 [Nocardioides aestuarii]|uniref:Septum formation family protein n=1 Tax=Nocardioides aestuarii TaxID=252231 RepID=A0ABW4TSE8_9ACTN